MSSSRFGISDGFKNPNGAIKIHTKRSNEKASKASKFSLLFSPKKTFYTPKYKYYTDDFYKS